MHYIIHEFIEHLFLEYTKGIGMGTHQTVYFLWMLPSVTVSVYDGSLANVGYILLYTGLTSGYV